MTEKKYGAIENLAVAILKQAVDDWMAICKDKDALLCGEKMYRQGHVSFDEIREFFCDEWCERLCFAGEPKSILTRLERERIDALKSIEGG